MTDYYAAPALQTSHKPRSYAVISGVSPWTPLVTHPNEDVREIVLDMLRLEHKYQRWPWWSPRVPEPPYKIELVDIRPVDVAIGWLLTAVAVWRALR